MGFWSISVALLYISSVVSLIDFVGCIDNDQLLVDINYPGKCIILYLTTHGKSVLCVVDVDFLTVLLYLVHSNWCTCKVMLTMIS